MVNRGVVCALVGAVLCGILVGCGKSDSKRPQVVPVKGTVYLDGKPYGPGRLTLSPVTGGNKSDHRSTVAGEIAGDGAFTLTAYEKGDGAPPGEYNVMLGDTGGDAGSTDPTAMMAAVSGGSLAAPLKVTIPPDGDTALELRFTSMKSPKKRNANAPLGAPTPN